MRIYHLDEINKIPDNVACIGYFDGVHLGHQKLIEKTLEVSKRKNLLPLVITFFPDPEKVIFNKDVLELTSLDKRIELFETFGINNCLLLDFNSKLMNKEPEDFIKDYLLKSNTKELIFGLDFRFGKNAKGNRDLLKDYFEIYEVPTVVYEGKKISSTYIRELIKEGNDELAHYLLNHD